MKMDLTEWNEIRSEADLPKDNDKLYMAHCNKAGLSFKHPKSAQFLVKMFRAKEITHFTNI